MLHAADLYRPHMDPDDHWDLACVYALAHRREIDLKGVLIDYPPKRAGDRNPDVIAVAQLNYITGLSVPMAVGTPLPMKSPADIQPDASPSDHGGIRMVLDILRKSEDPVVINVVGCCRDIAIAGKTEPELFAAKCAGIYLNAGTGSPKKALARQLEYNVSLGKSAYAAIFDLPCPVYWMPCFEEVGSRHERVVRQFGTHYRFRQAEILPRLSQKMQNFFACMFGRSRDHNWLGYLLEPPPEELLAKQAAIFRSMWCTGGFLHAAGYSVSRDGKIMPLEKVADDSVFSFDPIGITCSNEGVTRWSPDQEGKNRYIFHVRDLESYQSAMTKAMTTLLTVLP